MRNICLEIYSARPEITTRYHEMITAKFRDNGLSIKDEVNLSQGPGFFCSAFWVINTTPVALWRHLTACPDFMPLILPAESFPYYGYCETLSEVEGRMTSPKHWRERPISIKSGLFINDPHTSVQSFSC
jgi:hypothetical protein